MRSIFDSLRRSRRQVEAEIHEELEFHLASRGAELVAGGMSPDAARSVALGEFGDLSGTREYCLSQGAAMERGREWGERVTDFGHDLRVTMRGLGRRPAFTILAVVMLALGIGGSAAFWTVVRQMLRAPFDVPDRERVVSLWLQNPELHLQLYPRGSAVMIWRSRTQVFEAVEGVAMGTAVASANGESESVATASVSAGLLRFAGRTPALGRGFDLGDAGGSGQPVAMLSYGWWQRRYGADPGVLGKVVQVDGVSRVIVGVMPASLARAPGADQIPDLWLPTPALLPNDRQFVTLARIRAGMPKERVQAELASAAAEIGRLDPMFAKWHWSVSTAEDVLGATNLLTLRILLIAAGMILLVGCVNVSHLLLGRSLTRRTEFTIRSALGASRWRLIGLGAVEAGTLGVCAGLVGIAVAYLAVGILVHFRPSRMERLDSVHMDAAALAVSVGLGLIASLAASLVPMWQLGRDHAGVPQSGIRHSSGREVVWLRGALITLEVALALPMLIGAGLMGRSLWRLRNSDVGFAASGLVAVNLQLPSWRFRNAGDSAAFLASVTAAVRQLPGVQQVSRATGVPPRSGISFGKLSFEGAPELTDTNARMLASNTVAPDYFQTLGMTLSEGRGFDPTVAAGEAGVVIINRSMARRYWPKGGAIGHRLQIGGGEYARIIGVVSDVAALGVGSAEGDMQLYRPLDMTAGEGLLVVRSNLPYETLVGMVRRSVRSINAEVPAEVSQLSAYLDADIATRRLGSILFLAFASIALVLYAGGLFGVLNHAVTQRYKELGIRMALGASAWRVRWLVVRQLLLAVGVGVVIGCVTSWLGATLISSLLFEISARDALTYAVAIALTAVVTVLASYLPARRATQVVPVIALRGE